MENPVLLVTKIPDVIVDLRYSGNNNVCNEPISSYKNPFLPAGVLDQLKIAADEFRSEGFRIKVWDTMRTPETQEKLLKVNSDPRFVSSNSNHINGMAIDMTLVDESDKEIDMGTGFDEFTEESGDRAKNLTTSQLNNRKYIREIMGKAGFFQSEHEWWHFDYMGN